jgi:hypothetical protein
MMTEEDTPDSKHINPETSPDLTDKKGQMLVIYLPEGSVILDRTDINLSTTPHAIVEQITPKVEQKVIEPAVEEPVVQQLQPTLQEVVQLAVVEALRITQGASNKIEKKNEMPAIKSTQENVENSVIVPEPSPPELEKAPLNVARSPRVGRRVHVRRRRRINWVHGINTLLVGYVLIISIVPTVLSSAFGMAIYASNVSHPSARISQGDLMVSQIFPAIKVQVNDILLERDGHLWNLEVRKVTSNTSNGTLSTMTTTSTGGVALDETHVLTNNAGTYKVSRVIPKLGYVPIVLSSIIVKVLGGLSILILNLTVHMRRSRRRRLVTVIR